MIDFKQKIAEQISKTTNIPQEQIIEYIEIPADEKMGDFSFPCFSKRIKKSSSNDSARNKRQYRI